MNEMLFEIKRLKEHCFDILYFNHNLYDRLHSEILYLCDKMNHLNMNNEIKIITKEYNDIMFDYRNIHCFNGVFNNNFVDNTYAYDRYYLCGINKYVKDFDEKMKNIYKQNKENKRIINRVKIFSKKRKLCNDIRNIIISFLITPPKINSLQIY